MSKGQYEPNRPSSQFLNDLYRRQLENQQNLDAYGQNYVSKYKVPDVYIIGNRYCGITGKQVK
jgi:hypothetical protein